MLVHQLNRLDNSTASMKQSYTNKQQSTTQLFKEYCFRSEWEYSVIDTAMSASSSIYPSDHELMFYKQIYKRNV